MQQKRGKVTQEWSAGRSCKRSEGRSCKRSEGRLTCGLMCRSPQGDLGRAGHDVCLLDLRSLILPIHLCRQKDTSTYSEMAPGSQLPTF